MNESPEPKGFALARMKLVLEHWSRHRLRIVGILLFTMVAVAASVASPRIVGYVVDAIQGGLKNPAAFDSRRLLDFAVILIGLELVRTVTIQFLQFTRGMNNEFFLWQTRTSIYRRILDQGHRFTNQYPSGEVIERLDQDLDHLAFFSCSSLFMPIQASMTLLVSLFVLLRMNWKLTVLTVVPLTITVIIWLRLGPIVRKSWKEVRERIADTYRYLESSYSGISLVKAYTMEERSAKTFRELLNRRVKDTIKAIRVQILVQTLIREGVFQFGTLLIFAVGGQLVIGKNLTLGELVAFNSYIGMLIFPMMMISFFFINLKQAQVEEERI